MKNVWILLLSILLIPVSYSCLDNTDDGLKETDIYGYVNLFDEFGIRTDNHSMFVSAVDSVTEASGVTDVYGMYIIRDTPFGTYKLVFEKPGFGTYVMKGIEHVANGSPTYIPVIPMLSEKSTTIIPTLTNKVSGDTIYITVVTDPPSTARQSRYIRLFFDDKASVSDSTYKNFSKLLTIYKTPFTTYFLKEYFLDIGYESGQTIYLKAYGDSFYSNAYYDEDSVKVFPNINHDTPDALSFVLP